MRNRLALDGARGPPYAGQDNVSGFRSNGLDRQKFQLRRAVKRAGVLSAFAAAVTLCAIEGQTCTTQARMSDTVRTDLSGAAMNLATLIKAGDSAKVEAVTIADFASPTAFAATAALIQSTAPKVAGDALRVEQVYELDARGRKAGETTDADFSCALTGTTSEADFSISGLPPGMYGFAMVEATGDRNWLLAFLLRQDDGVWKLAGFYPRARTVGGHDGLWYWTEARSHAKAKELWTAWLFYGEADELLRPANFLTSTNLDRLRSEQRVAAPPELINDIGPNHPLVVKGSDGTEYRFSSIGTAGSEDGKQLNMILHLSADSISDPAAAKIRSKAAAAALIDAHKELRQDVSNVWVFVDSRGHEPFVTEEAIADIP